MTFANLARQAEAFCAEHLTRIAEPSQYIAGFRTRLGRELAVERQRDGIYCWSEAVSLTDAPASPQRHYPADKSRNSNLNGKNCPRLRLGNAAHYWIFDRLDQFEAFLRWYAQSPLAAAVVEPPVVAQPSASSPNWSQEIEKVLTENELLINNWSPIHLHRYLKDWFWKSGVDEVKALDFWRKSCQYLYLPRLRDDMVFRNTLAAGAASEDFFGITYGKEDGKYKGFTLGTATTPILDEALLLIEPAVARAYAEAERAARAAAAQPQPAPLVVGEGAPVAPSGAGVAVSAQPTSTSVAAKVEKRRFYATVNIEPVGAKLAFANIVEEVLQQFTAKPGVKVSISVEIEAESAEAFDDALQRAVKENCNVLKFSSAEFES